MSKTRAQLNTKHNEKQPALTLPNELYMSTDGIGSYLKSKDLANAALSCKTFQFFFQPQLNDRGPKERLIQVLQVNENSKSKILETAKNNPRLFFIKATAEDLAMDLAGNQRTIKNWSPYQALFGTCDRELLAEVKPYLDAYLDTLKGEIVFNNVKYKNGKDLAIQQQKEKFPNGFDFPPSTDEFNRIVNNLAIAVTNDLQLQQNWKNPNAETSVLLLQFRDYLKPGIVEMGHHYNMNDVIRTHEIYKQYWDPWNGCQLMFWTVFIIGFQERLMTAPYLQAALMGLENHINKNQPLRRHFEVMNYFTNKMITVFPLSSEDPSYRLGEDFFIECYYPWASWKAVARIVEAPALLKIMSSKHSETFSAYAQTNETSGSSFRIT